MKCIRLNSMYTVTLKEIGKAKKYVNKMLTYKHTFTQNSLYAHIHFMINWDQKKEENRKIDKMYT